MIRNYVLVLMVIDYLLKLSMINYNKNYYNRINVIYVCCFFFNLGSLGWKFYVLK